MIIINIYIYKTKKISSIYAALFDFQSMLYTIKPVPQIFQRLGGQKVILLMFFKLLKEIHSPNEITKNKLRLRELVPFSSKREVTYTLYRSPFQQRIV